MKVCNRKLNCLCASYAHKQAKGKAKKNKTANIHMEWNARIMTLTAFLHVHCVCNTHSTAQHGTVHLHGIVFATFLNGFREILINFIQFFCVVNDIFSSSPSYASPLNLSLGCKGNPMTSK